MKDLSCGAFDHPEGRGEKVDLYDVFGIDRKQLEVWLKLADLDARRGPAPRQMGGYHAPVFGAGGMTCFD